MLTKLTRGQNTTLRYLRLRLPQPLLGRRTSPLGSLRRYQPIQCGHLTELRRRCLILKMRRRHTELKGLSLRASRKLSLGPHRLLLQAQPPRRPGLCQVFLIQSYLRLHPRTKAASLHDLEGDRFSSRSKTCLAWRSILGRPTAAPIQLVLMSADTKCASARTRDSL